MERVNKMVSERPMVIFSKSSCCMSHTIKTLFCDFGVNPAVYELDEISRGREIEQALSRLGSSPSVFIGGELVGGANQERRHKETSSFHLSLSLMTITLDDVSSLFHISMPGNLFTAHIISQETTHLIFVEYLRVIVESVIKVFIFMRGAHFLLSWLRDRYGELVGHGMFEEAFRVYMLHLVGCTFLADKSHVYINAKYMWLFNRLEHCSWACGCAALTILYGALGEATVFETRQLVDYMSLF
ncbi:protein MAIN-LIKE 2-like [Vicia villosa]|uniref:protein MAIN-LIKE 2-like n=1 Tax=Vicia villosa TaxID=3911 RepID=UPI00273C589E|nr:protein MAIN-LIKE 2-like [Vicia villosa]